MDANAEAHAENLNYQMKIAIDAYEDARKKWDAHHQQVLSMLLCRKSGDVDAMKTHLEAMDRISKQKKDLLKTHNNARNALLAYLDQFRDVSMLRKYFSPKLS